MNLFVLRHCECLGNVDVNEYSKVAYQGDMPLTDRGIDHTYPVASKVGELVRDAITRRTVTEDPVIYHSPYIRAKYTAERIPLHLIPYRTHMRESPLLVEQNYGEALGCHSMDEFLEKADQKERELRTRMGSYFYAFPRGESLFDVTMRAELFLSKIEHLRYNPIIIVSHAVFCSMLEYCLTGTMPDPFAWENGEIRWYGWHPKEPLVETAKEVHKIPMPGS